MTNQEMRTLILIVANSARASGQWVKRETRIGDSIEVSTMGGEEEGFYRFEYTEAQNLFREAHRAANKFGLESWEDWILFTAQGW